MQKIIEMEFQTHMEVVAKAMNLIGPSLEVAATKCRERLQKGGKILLFGNGGSAADAQHIAAELVGRYKVSRKGLAATALTTDTSILTAVGNDFGYGLIFKRQVEALANGNDIVIGISTSGTSHNVIEGLKMAKKLGCVTIGMSGGDGGEMSSLCDVSLVVPSQDVPRIQEVHILMGHILCELIETDTIGN